MQNMNLLASLMIICTFMITNISIKPTTNPSIKTASTSVYVSSNPSLTPALSEKPKDANVVIETTNTPNTNLPGEIITYPNAYAISPNIYESTDDPNTITDWYKNMLKKRDMNTTSFVTTNTNNNIKNVLAANNGAWSMHIEISKSSESNKTTIKIN